MPEVIDCHGCNRPIRQEGVPWRMGDPSHDDHADGCSHYACNPYKPEACAIDPGSGGLILAKTSRAYAQIIQALLRAQS